MLLLRLVSLNAYELRCHPRSIVSLILAYEIQACGEDPKRGC